MADNIGQDSQSPSTTKASEDQTLLRRRKTGTILSKSPIVLPETPQLLTQHSSLPKDQPSKAKDLPKKVRIASKDDTVKHRNRSGTDGLGSSRESKCNNAASSLKKGPESQNNQTYDAVSEKSQQYLKSDTKALKSSLLYQENVNSKNNNNNDVLLARRKLRQLQINYSKTNTNLNDRIIMCDILKVTLHQVIPRMKVIRSIERRLRNQRINRRRRALARGRAAPDVTQTIADMEKERKERIKEKQTIPRTVESLKEITAEDVQEMKNYRYVRVNERTDLKSEIQKAAIT